MNRNHLAVYRSVVEHGNITAASAALRVSQPAISAQVAALERALGTRLLDRLPRGVRPTAVGEVLFDYARRIGHLEEEALRAVADLQGLRRGRLAVGASTSIGSYLLPGFMGKLAKAHPGLDLTLAVSNTETIQRDLLDGVLDVGLTEGFASEEDFEIAVFREDELKLIAPVNHPVAEGGATTLEEVLEFPILTREEGSGTRAVLERAFHRVDRDLRPRLALGSSEALKRGVAAGLGLAWVSELTLEPELGVGRLTTVEVENFRIRRPLHRLMAKGRHVPAPVRAFEALLF